MPAMYIFTVDSGYHTSQKLGREVRSLHQ